MEKQLMEEFEKAKNHQEQLEAVLRNKKLNIQKLEDEEKKVRSTAAKCALFLDKNALTPYDDHIIEYLKMEMENLKHSATGGLEEARQKITRLNEVSAIENGNLGAERDVSLHRSKFTPCLSPGLFQR